jgi:hypothetical protein
MIALKNELGGSRSVDQSILFSVIYNPNAHFIALLYYICLNIAMCNSISISSEPPGICPC